MTQTSVLASIFEPFRITEEQTELYRENGHVLLKGVLSGSELASHRQLIAHAAQRLNTEQRKLEDRDTYGKAFLQIMNLWEFDESVRHFTLAKRFGDIAARLMGVDRVRLYHDQALFKEPGGGHTPWHQDQYYWPVDTDNTITMWMPLVDISEAMGMLTFASGSQHQGFVGNIEISDESEIFLGNFVQEKGYPVTRAETMNAGDATFHSGWTLHAAAGNYSDKMREVMTIIYVADGARVAEPQNPNQENDRQRWLMGKAPGQLIDSALNPII